MSSCSKSSSNADSASLIIRGNEYWTGHEEEEEEVLKKEEEDIAWVDAGGKHLGQTVGQKISGILCQLGLLTLVLGLLTLHSSCLGLLTLVLSAQPKLFWQENISASDSA